MLICGIDTKPTWRVKLKNASSLYVMKKSGVAPHVGSVAVIPTGGEMRRAIDFPRCMFHWKCLFETQSVEADSNYKGPLSVESTRLRAAFNDSRERLCVVLE
jgi:hypothetical protein